MNVAIFWATSLLSSNLPHILSTSDIIVWRSIIFGQRIALMHISVVHQWSGMLTKFFSLYFHNWCKHPLSCYSSRTMVDHARTSNSQYRERNRNSSLPDILARSLPMEYVWILSNVSSTGHPCSIIGTYTREVVYCSGLGLAKCSSGNH